ncbi:hypothetical protein ACFYZE_10375 [Streptomyces sp. NPDC001796]|uniref:hypothetical protein n=1 Tax=Streptomyces sp. NPDC001796 TaxID=3364609 RepID=UPI0036A5AD8D
MPTTATDPVLTIAVVLVSALTTLVRAWIAHRTAVSREQEHTERTRIAVGGSASEHRAAVVRACAELEAAAQQPAARQPALRRRGPRSP